MEGTLTMEVNLQMKGSLHIKTTKTKPEGFSPGEAGMTPISARGRL